MEKWEEKKKRKKKAPTEATEKKWPPSKSTMYKITNKVIRHTKKKLKKKSVTGGDLQP